MSAAPGPGRHRTSLVAGAVLLACLAVAFVAPPTLAGAAILIVALAVVLRSWLTSAFGLLAVLVATVLWIPAGRYSLIGVPQALPWRIVTLLLLLGLFLTLALDRTARWQPSPLLRVVLVFPSVALLSAVANIHDLDEQGLVAGGILATVQFFLLAGMFVITRQLVTTDRIADWLLRLMVLAAFVISLSVGVERLTGTNVFLMLQHVLPVQLVADAPSVSRAGVVRALGSANHPIALSVVLIMLLPVAVFLSRHSRWPRHPDARRALFLGGAFVMVLAAFLTGSRTFVIMLVVMGGVLFFANWIVFTRALFVAAPLGLFALLLLPGTVLKLVGSFLDPASLIESQYASAGWRGSGRLADLGPSLVEAREAPILGTGVGSRVVTGPDANALILDNQYTSTLLEAGIVGLVAMIVLLFVPVGVMLRRYRDERLSAPERNLALALACAFASYGVAAFFFDAFGFQQTLMVFFMLVGVASWLTHTAEQRHRPGAATSAANGGVPTVRVRRPGVVRAPGVAPAGVPVGSQPVE